MNELAMRQGATPSISPCPAAFGTKMDHLVTKSISNVTKLIENSPNSLLKPMVPFLAIFLAGNQLYDLSCHMHGWGGRGGGKNRARAKLMVPCSPK